MYRFFFIIVVLIIPGLSVSQSNLHFETLVYENDTWSYFVGNSEPESNWRNIDFPDSLWLTGQGGFGYGDNDDHTEVPVTRSLYIRNKFEIIDKEIINNLILDIDYDDAFVAYLNGIEIARSGIEGNPPPFDQLGNSHEALIKDGFPPKRFSISDEVTEEILLNGNNVLAIQVHNATANSSDMSIRPFLSASIDYPEIVYNEVHPYFIEPVQFEISNLPIVLIETEAGIEIPDEPKVNAHLSIIHSEEGVNSIHDQANIYDGNIGIEVRGSYSATFPQKPFGFETRDQQGENLNLPILNMPEENDWILLSNYNDKVMLRNVLSFHLFNEMGHYAPRTEFCEVWLNESYEGIYILTERIKQDKNRVDIAKLTEEDNEGDGLSGGYIFKNDYYEQDGSDSWEGSFSPESLPYKEVRWVYHDPKASKITESQKQYLKDYVNSFETILFGSNYANPETGYRSYIDVPSFIDYLIISELSRNVDAYKKSKYYYKDKDSKGGELHSGPVWDFDWSYKNIYGDLNDGQGWAHVSNSWMYPTPNGWIERLMKDEWFRNQLGERYHTLREGILSNEYLFAFIDDNHAILEEAQERHYARWPILGINVGAPEGNEWQPDSYEGEIQKFKNWLELRLTWLDENMPTAGLSSYDELENSKLNIKVFPNPCLDYVYIESNEKIQSASIHDIYGKELKYFSGAFPFLIQIDVSDLPQGIYQVKTNFQDSNIIFRTLVKN